MSFLFLTDSVFSGWYRYFVLVVCWLGSRDDNDMVMDVKCVEADGKKLCVVISTGTRQYVGHNEDRIIIYIGQKDFTDPWIVVRALLFVLGFTDDDSEEVIEFLKQYMVEKQSVRKTGGYVYLT